MPQRLFRIVYMSRNLLPGTPEQIQAEVDGILATSRSNNAPVGVGGMLLFNNGCFLQVLEGDYANISLVFERIQRDPRHDQVIVLDASYPAARLFTDWSMAFVGLNASDARRYGSLSLDSSKMAMLVDDDVLSQLQRLVEAEEAEIDGQGHRLAA